MFIKECLRMAGPFNLTHKTLAQDLVVEGVTIPKGEETPWWWKVELSL